MKAGVLYKNEDIRYDDIPTPEPKAGEILVKVKMTGICGSDIPRVLKMVPIIIPLFLVMNFQVL